MNTTAAGASPVDCQVRPRVAFEAWISAPPYEREVERFGEGSAWPGNYRELDVDLAWCAWSAAMAATRERCAKLCETWMEAAERETGPEAAGWLHQMAQHMRGLGA